jgi:hypothetical protein
VTWTPDELEAFLVRRRRRNVAIAVALAAMVILFYAITIGRMSA